MGDFRRASGDGIQRKIQERIKLKPIKPLILLLFLIPAAAAGQVTNDPLSGLVETVTGKDSVIQVDPTILDIVGDFYADTLISTSRAVDMLSFITNAYGEHGYTESGSWVKKAPGIYYFPTQEELPDYDINDFHLPIKGRLTSLYGYRPGSGRFHHGIDISLNLGDTVKSALPGVVSKTGFDKGGYGNYVVVTHSGGVETVYGHLMMPIVKPGEKISIGSPIGLGGNTGNSTGPHLHLETRYRGVALDPISWFGLDELLR